MTNLNTPPLHETTKLNDDELDAAIARHFGPRRHTEPAARPEPMKFEPAWYRRSVAACYGACEQGEKTCPTPDTCRLPTDDSDFGALEGLTRSFPLAVFAWACITAVALAVVVFL